MPSFCSSASDSLGRPRGFLLAVTISAAAHALIALLLGTLTTLGGNPVADTPLAEILVLVVSDEPIQSVSVAEPVQTTTNVSGSNTGESETVQVRPAPVDTDPGVPETNLPRVTYAGPPASPGDASESGPTFLGVQIPAKSVVFVIDRSVSMGLTDGLRRVKQELTEKLDRLPAAARFQVIFYDTQVECLTASDRDGLLANTEENRRLVRALTDSIRARSGTDHLKALLRALALRPEAVLFITDADDLGRQQVRSITDANAGKTTIHALQWGLTAAENESLKDLARLNRGSYRHFGP
jgi:hypothetical protein